MTSAEWAVLFSAAVLMGCSSPAAPKNETPTDTVLAVRDSVVYDSVVYKNASLEHEQGIPGRLIFRFTVRNLAHSAALIGPATYTAFNGCNGHLSGYLSAAARESWSSVTPHWTPDLCGFNQPAMLVGGGEEHQFLSGFRSSTGLGPTYYILFEFVAASRSGGETKQMLLGAGTLAI